MRRTFLLAFFAPISMILVLSSNAHALAMSEGHAQITGFSITPDSGSIVWSGDWYANSSANATYDVGSSSDIDFDFVEGLATATSVAASTAQADAAGATNFAAGTAESSGSASLPNPLAGFAQTDSTNFLDNMFQIIGGTGSVEVEFSLDYELHLRGEADAAGSFDQTAYVELFLSDFGATEVRLDRLETISGVDIIVDFTYTGTLTGSYTLAYDTEYFFSLTSDSEHYIVNTPVPEPASMVLFGAGLTVLALKRRGIKAGSSQRP